jgi:hypothetical protein
MELKVTLMSLMEIDNLPDDSVAQEYSFNEEFVTIEDNKGSSIQIPIILLGATITLQNYKYEYESEITRLDFSIDSSDQSQMTLFKAIVKKVIKGKIPEFKFFDLTNYKLVFNESTKTFSCGCESFSVERAKELVSFLSGCINTTKKPAVKKK